MPTTRILKSLGLSVVISLLVAAFWWAILYFSFGAETAADQFARQFMFFFAIVPVNFALLLPVFRHQEQGSSKQRVRKNQPEAFGTRL